MTVEVGVTPEPEPAPAPVVVVADTGDDDSGTPDGLVELAREVGELRAIVAGLVPAVEEVEQTAEQAESTADLALDVAVNEPEPEPEPEAETTEPDEPPARVHPVHRPMRELFGGHR